MTQTKLKTQAIDTTLLSFLMPVGTVYTNKSVSTNPATLFGFGTWVAIAGRVVVGVGTSDQAFSAGATGGESNHLLTGAESGEKGHNHTQNAHSHTVPILNAGTGSANVLRLDVGNQTVSTNSVTATNIAVVASNATSSHNNLQPYATAYVWERTA